MKRYVGWCSDKFSHGNPLKNMVGPRNDFFAYCSFHVDLLVNLVPHPVSCKLYPSGLWKHQDNARRQILMSIDYYRPQRSCEGYVFTGVCLSTGGGGVPDQVHPPGSRHPPGTRYTPLEQTPETRYTPGTRYIPWDQVHPPEQTPLGLGTSLGTRYTPRSRPPWDQVHPLGPGTPPGTRYTPPPEIRPLMRTVRILLECILVK